MSEAGSTGRNHGIDLLKILSMYMICILHVLGKGGILHASRMFSLNYEIAWGLEIAAYCSVNCFALASGFTMADRTFKYHRILTLWLQVAFYSAIIAVLFALSRGAVDGRILLKSLLPVLSNQYWYFTAYFGMFFFAPFLNLLIGAIDRKGAAALAITLFAVLSVLPTFARADLFYANGGYSMLWLAAMYLAGGLMKKFRVAEGIGAKMASAGYGASVVLTLLLKFAVEFFAPRLGFHPGNAKLLTTYVSPLIVIESVCLFVLLSQARIRGARTCRFIRLLVPMSFSVYLIHVHPLVFNHLIHDAFVGLSRVNPLLMIPGILGCALAIYLACSAIDLPRHMLFQALQVDRRCQRLLERASHAIARK